MYNWSKYGLLSIPKTLSSAVHLMSIGDSIIDNAISGNSDGNTYYDSRGIESWLQVISGNAFKYLANYTGSETQGDNKGVGGDKTADVLARLSADILANKPNVVLIHIGTNDITDAIAASTIKANLETICARITEVGAIALLCTIPPRNDENNSVHGLTSKDWTASQRLVHHDVNRWIRDHALKTDGITLVDSYGALVDPTTTNGDLLAGYSYDGLHPSPTMAYHIAKHIWDNISGFVTERKTLCYSPSDVYDVTDNPFGNVLPNTDLSGTGGTVGTDVSGTAPDGFQIERSAGTSAVVTSVASIVNRNDGDVGKEIDLVVTSAGTGSSIAEVRVRNTPSSITTGVFDATWYEAECEVTVTSSSNSLSPIHYIYLQLWDATTDGERSRAFNEYTYTEPATDFDTKFPDVAWSGTLKTPPILTEGTTGLRYYLVIGIDESVADDFTINIGRPSINQLTEAPVFT